MAVYKTVSIKEVIGRILRNTKQVNSSWIQDIYEWIWEGMEQTRVRSVLQPASQAIIINNYMGEIPCEAVIIDAISYNGYRLNQSNSVLDIPNLNLQFPNIQSNTFFETKKTKITTTTTDLITNTTIKDSLYKYNYDAQSYPFSNFDFYKLALNTIQTSFATGTIIVYYRYYETDSDGIITIPDNESLKQFLYWNTLAMMIGAGFEHPVFKFQDAEARAVQWKLAATNSLKGWTPDKAASFQKNWVSLIPNNSLHNKFFI